MSARPSRHRRFALGTMLLHGLLLGGVAGTASAQSAQKYAFQLAALSTSIGGGGSSSTSGFGVEPQLRYNRLYSSEQFAISLGLGGQYTTHSVSLDANTDGDLSIVGAFIEPRLVPVIGSTRVFPYLSGRLAVLQQSSNYGSSSGGMAFGGGAGVVVKLSPRINLDAGAQLVRQQFGDFVFNDNAKGEFNPVTTYAAKIGLNIGFPR